MKFMKDMKESTICLSGLPGRTVKRSANTSQAVQLNHQAKVRIMNKFKGIFGVLKSTKYFLAADDFDEDECFLKPSPSAPKLDDLADDDEGNQTTDTKESNQADKNTLRLVCSDKCVIDCYCNRAGNHFGCLCQSQTGPLRIGVRA